MKENQRLCRLLHFTVEKDCYKYFLRPPDPSKGMLLSLLREEIREDTNFITNSMTLPKTNPSEPRY